MNRIFTGFILLMGGILPSFLHAQTNIPLGSWRSHFSFRSATSLAITVDRVYASSENALYYFDREDNTLMILSASQGLSDAGISRLKYEESKGVLFIGYRNGNIDLLRNGRISNIRTIMDAGLPGNRRINDIYFHHDFAWLATDYGISLLELQSGDVEESFFNLGPAGQPLEINQLAVWNDSIFASTNGGLISNALRGANLSDFHSWKRYSEEEFPASGGPILLAIGPGGMYAGISGQGLFFYENGKWIERGFKTTERFVSLRFEADRLFITLENGLYTYSVDSDNYTEIVSPLIRQPRDAGVDKDGNIWLADNKSGLLSNFEGSFKAYVPQGPLADAPGRLYVHEETIIAVYGLASETESEGEVAGGGFSVFSEGRWSNFIAGETPGMPEVRGLSDVVFNPQTNQYYFTSLFDGLLQWDPLNPSNFRSFIAGQEGVSLRANQEGHTQLSRIDVDSEGHLWMIQPGSDYPLHRFSPSDNSWTTYLENNVRAKSASDILILPNNDKWLQLSGENGILVFNETEGNSRSFTGQASGGILLERRVTSLALDLERQLWVGLGQGVNYFPNPASALNTTHVNIAFPVYQGRHLLNTEPITAIGIDGGNRKWLGTPSGLWVAGDYGDTIYYSFTAENSPLPDNSVIDLAINQRNGEVFIATASGLVSYRSGATLAGYQHAAMLKVFPNPVHPGYSGNVGISGLANDAIVKITDVSGKLVKELQAEGGTASWDLTDFRGRRPATGVYLIFSATKDGIETLAGKMAIVN